MATARKCDRCGKYYDNNTSTLKGFSGSLCGVAFVRRESFNGNRYIAEKDLCDECISKFKRFLDGCELREE